jgi:hypothetical protein
MNNTRTLAIVAVLMAATLVVGTFATMATTQSAYAYAKKKPQGHDDKKTRDNGSWNRNGNTITALKCQNKGSASGFDTAVNQECENTICTHPSAGATCVSEAAVNKTAAIDPCLTCFTQNLNSDEQAAFIQAVVKLGFKVSSIEDVCKIINTGTVSAIQIEIILITLVLHGDITEGHARALFDCLQQAGLISGDARLTIQR